MAARGKIPITLRLGLEGCLLRCPVGSTTSLRMTDYEWVRPDWMFRDASGVHPAFVDVTPSPLPVEVQLNAYGITVHGGLAPVQ